MPCRRGGGSGGGLLGDGAREDAKEEATMALARESTVSFGIKLSVDRVVVRLDLKGLEDWFPSSKLLGDERGGRDPEMEAWCGCIIEGLGFRIGRGDVPSCRPGSACTWVMSTLSTSG